MTNTNVLEKAARRTPREAAEALQTLNRQLVRKLKSSEERTQGLESEVASLREENARLEKDTSLAVMHMAGLEAELVALRKQNPYCELLQDTGESFANGSLKSFSRLVYEKAFDAEAVRLGVEQPEEYRTR